jgi:hypothetical protein
MACALVFITLVVTSIIKHRNKYIITEFQEEAASEVLDCVDNPSTPVDGDKIVAVRYTRKTRYARGAYYGSLARCKLNCDIRTRAMEMVVKEYVNQLMASDDVRHIDRPHLIPFAVEAAFTPTIYEIEAKMISSSRTMLNRHDAMARSYWSLDPTSWWIWPSYRTRPDIPSG